MHRTSDVLSSVTAPEPVDQASDTEASAAWYFASLQHQWRLVGVLLVVTSLGAVDRQVITLLVNPIRDTLRMTDVQVA
ncbi:MAG: hypothetical protein ACREUT_11520 [Steroidobacteraceae bacterium]